MSALLLFLPSGIGAADPRRGHRDDAEAPASETAGAAGSGAPGSAAPAVDSLATMAACLRGHARDDDGAAFALLRRAGFAAPEIAAALPHARALARGQAGARPS